jgi:GR25 family glycosyltransferase involved in LPS biosynthesis
MSINFNEDNKSCLEYIDAILYINLEHRHDRKEHILNEIKKIDSELSKVHRIDAIYNKNIGALGCALSHVKALNFCLENTTWNTFIIFEDDFTFFPNNINEINNSISYLLETIPNFDVILLGVGNHDLNTIPTSDPLIKRVISSQTASGYIITRKYINKLLEIFEECVKNLNVKYNDKWCIDQHWKKIMPNANWYTYKDRIGYQYDNYSDIEMKNVKYNC